MEFTHGTITFEWYWEPDEGSDEEIGRVPHEYVFALDYEQNVAFSQAFVQGGETYSSFDIPECIVERLEEMGFEVVE